MTTLAESIPQTAAWSDDRWYAVYTCARHEKTVTAMLKERDVEAYLPIYHAVHRWQDRNVRLQLPLFPSYLFVHIPLRDRLTILSVPGVVHLVGAAGVPIPLPERDIEAIRQYLATDAPAEPHPYLTTGHRVRIKSGPLEGCEGIVVRRKGRVRVIIQLDLIMSAISIEVDAADLEPAAATRPTRYATTVFRHTRTASHTVEVENAP